MSTQQTVPLSEAAQTRKAVSNILKGSAGNLVEWYDLYVYTVFAAYFQSHFFTSEDPLQAGLEAMAVFSTSFLMRPIGSWFFGRYADRNGRKAALTLSVTLMSGNSQVDIQSVHVIESEDFDLEEEGVQAIIGRDILNRCVFRYFGPHKIFDLSF